MTASVLGIITGMDMRRDSHEPSGYAAFISYRHLLQDTEVAQEVQRMLETYRLPRHMASAQGVRLGKCFRDEDELVASHSLPESIEHALATSKTLVVICSPATQESSWVLREIEAFEQLHGRERIICVLAAGDSATSIPAVLKTRMQPDAEGVMQQMPSEPLAVDWRPESRQKRKAETLRLVAAVADCGYDDLRQRERARKRKRIAAGTVAAVVALAVILAFAMQFQGIRQAALVEESKNLAAQALAQYEQGEYVSAISTALAALPSSEADPSRPLVPEAKEALERILAINPDPDHPWQLLFAYEVDGNVADLSYGQEQHALAVLDDTGTFSLYDVVGGTLAASEKLAIFDTEGAKNPSSTWMIRVAFGDDLFAASSTQGMTCVGMPSLEPRWSHPGLYTIGAQVASETGDLAILSAAGPGLISALVDPSTGDLIAAAGHTVEPASENFYRESFSVADDASRAYCGVDGSLVSFDFEAHECHMLAVSDHLVQSTKAAHGFVMVSAAEVENENVDLQQIPFDICVLEANDSGEVLRWSYSDTYAATLSTRSDAELPLNSPPKIRSIFQRGQETLAIATAGNILMMFNVENGQMLYQREFSASILDAMLYAPEGGNNFAIPVILSNGTLDCVFLPEAGRIMDPELAQTDIPHVINKGQMGECFGVPVAFVRPYDRPNMFLCYLFHPYNDDKDREESSLNELLERAHGLVGE